MIFMTRTMSVKRPLSIAVLLLFAASFVLSIPKANAAGSIVDGAVSFSSVVAGANTTSTVSFTGISGNTTDLITVTYPVGYSLPDGTYTAFSGLSSVICNASCATPSQITVNGVNKAVNNVVVDSGSRTVSITLSSPQALSAGLVSFVLKAGTGITNPTAAGATGDFVITTAADGSDYQDDVTGPTIVAGSVDHIEFDTQPAGSVSGATLTTQPEVQLYDVYNNPLLTSGDNVTLTLNSGAGSLSGGLTVATVSGLASFTTVAYTALVDHEDFVLHATTTGNISVNSNSVDSDVVATDLVFTQEPADSNAVNGGDITSGVTFETQPVVTAEDADGRTDTDYTDTVSLTDDSVVGTLDGTASVAAVAGVATFTGLSYTADGDHETFTLTADDGTINTDTTASLDADVLATELAFTTQPANSISGVSMDQPVVEGHDGDGQLDTDFAGAVNLSLATGAGSLSGATTTAAVAGVVTYTDVVYHATLDGQAFSLLASQGVLANDTSSAITSDVVATKLIVLNITSGAPNGDVQSGDAFSATVKALDDENTLDTDATPSVTMSVDAGSFTGTLTDSLVAGELTFSDLTFTATQDHELFDLTATDNGFAPLTPWTYSDVDADVVATNLVIVTDPDNGADPDDVTSGVVFSTQPKVEAQDAQNVVDVNYNDTITLTEDGAGTLDGTVAVAAVNGSSTFAGLSYSATGEADTFSLTADDGNLTPDTDGTFDSNVLATKLVFTTQPAGSVSGEALTTQPVVTAEDADGLTDEDYTGTVELTENGAGTLDGTTSLAAVAGVATGYSAAYHAAVDGESFTLTASDGDLTDATSSSIDSDVVATKLALVNVTPSNAPVNGDIVSGDDFNVTVRTLDAEDKLDTDGSYDVVLSSTTGTLTGGDLQATVSGEYTFSNVVFTGTFDHQTLDLTATDDGSTLDSVTENLDSDVVYTQILFSLDDTNPVVGDAIDYTLTAADASDVTDTDYDPSGHLFGFGGPGVGLLANDDSPDETSPTVPSSGDVEAAFSNGVSAGTITFTHAHALGALFGGEMDSGKVGSTGNVDVQHSDTTDFTVTPSTYSANSGTAINVMVTAVDTYGNVADSGQNASPYTGTVVLSTDASGATISQQIYTFLSGDAGTKTFTNNVVFNTVENDVTLYASQQSDAGINGESNFIDVSGAAVTLGVTNVSLVKSVATKNNTYADGWEWVFNVTVPTNETLLQMSFDNFSGPGALAATNIRFYSAQSSNHTSSSPVLITSAGAGSAWSNSMTLNQDMDPQTPGRQVQITVQAKVPTSTTDGSYSTSYGIQTNPET
jgi:large repetitive protein